MKFIDAHNDLLQRALSGKRIWEELIDGHSDFVRMRRAGILAQVLSVWVPVKYENEHRSYEQAIRLIQAFSHALEYSTNTKQIFSTEELEWVLKNDWLGFMLGMEGSHPIEHDLDKLKEFARLGIKYMSMTWNNSVSWASSAKDESNPEFTGQKGLNEFGKDVVRQMNQLGIMPDVSHVGEQTFWDIISTSKKPVIASHSSIYNLCQHVRNLKDDQLKAIAKSGGMVCINFFSGFLDQNYFQKRKLIIEKNQTRISEFKKQVTGNDEAVYVAEDHFIGQLLQPIRPPLSLLIDHIDYAVKLIGINHVGIGSDFDGIETAPEGIDSVLDLPKLAIELEKRGYSHSDIEKIMYKNFIRVFYETQ